MFYLPFLLDKKGSLSKAWFAAHWEQKLTKSHVFETSIEQSVDGLVGTNVNIALRSSGHLLLGIVRIYSRKTKYLLADCSEIFIKIGMAFRPDVNLDEKTLNDFETINLPEQFQDFDCIMPQDYSVISDINGEFSNQTRLEDITMREEAFSSELDVSNNSFGASTLRDISTEPENERNNKSMFDIDLETLLSTVKKRHTKGREMKANVYYDGGEDTHGNSEDILAGGIFEETMYDIPELDVSPDVPYEEVQSNASALSLDTPSEDMHYVDIDEGEIFFLLPVTTTQSKENKRHSIKNKLFVDSSIQISYNDIKSQSNNLSTETSTMELAPPSRFLMQYIEMSDVSKLFDLPARPVCSTRFLKHYTLSAKSISSRHELNETITERSESVIKTKSSPRKILTSISNILDTEITQISETNRKENIEGMTENVPINENSSLLLKDLACDKTSEKVTENEVKNQDGVLENWTENVSLNRVSSEIECTTVATIDTKETAVGDMDMKRDIERAMRFRMNLKCTVKGHDKLRLSSVVPIMNRREAAKRVYDLLLLQKHKYLALHQKEFFGDIEIHLS